MCSLLPEHIGKQEGATIRRGAPASCLGLFLPESSLQRRSEHACELDSRSRSADAQVGNFELALCLGGVIYPGTPPMPAQMPMRPSPGRRFGLLLNPMVERSLVAPLCELGHDAAMRSRAHEGMHRRLIAPHRAGPIGAIGVAQNGNSKVAGRMSGLPQHEQGLHQEDRQIPPRPHPEARHRDERHQPFSLLAGV
jgi:hypothetical protein